MRHPALGLGAGLAILVLAAVPLEGCGRDETGAKADRPSTAALETRFPAAIGAFHAAGATRAGVAEVAGRRLVSAERNYDDAGREATLRIVDVSTERSLVSSFAVARDLSIDELDALTRPIHVAHEPAIVQWTRDTGESEVQVLVDDRYLVTLKVWPADRRDEASDLFPTRVVEALGSSR